MNNNEIGVLLIHGFAGRRNELNLMNETLTAKGYKTIMPVLAGHEASRSEFRKSKYNDWINSAQIAYNELENQSKEIVIIGFSMGGLIGANICKEKKVKALIFVNTPIYFWNMKRIINNLFCDFSSFSKRYLSAGMETPKAVMIEFLKILNNRQAPRGNLPDFDKYSQYC